MTSNSGEDPMSTITTKDGTQIYYKDWGKGPVVTFSHGWPLNSDAWDGQMLFLAQNGLRVVAHDRRGHGRSSPRDASFGDTQLECRWKVYLHDAPPSSGTIYLAQLDFPLYSGPKTED
jgi:pimeloyl-ACP methyl ester carboxylesterase